MKQLIIFTLTCILLMAFGCVQTNKSTTSVKENAKTTPSESMSNFPDVSASQAHHDEAMADSEQPSKPAGAQPSLADEDPSAYDMKEKEEQPTAANTSSTKKETVTANLNDPKLFAISEKFGLRLNETALNKESETGLEIIAIRDNRCPVGVNCFRAGEVEIDLKINEKEAITLTFPTAEKPNSQDSYETAHYIVKLVGASRKGRPNLTKPKSGSLGEGLGGIEVYLKVDKIIDEK